MKLELFIAHQGFKSSDRNKQDNNKFLADMVI